MSPPKTPTTTTAPAEPAPEPTPPPAPATPTPAAEWRRAGVYDLPYSGKAAELTWPGLYALALTGEVPNPLAEAVLRLVSGAAARREGAPPPTEDEDLAAYRKNARALLAIMARCMVRPRLILDRPPEYDRDEIGPGDLHERDVLWVYNHFVQEGPASEWVHPFRRA